MVEKIGYSVLEKPMRYKYKRHASITEQKEVLKRRLLLSLARLQAAGIDGKGVAFPVIATFTHIPDMQALHLLQELEKEGKVISTRKGMLSPLILGIIYPFRYSISPTEG